MILMPSSKSFGDKYEKLIQRKGSVYAAIFYLPNLFEDLLSMQYVSPIYSKKSKSPNE